MTEIIESVDEMDVYAKSVLDHIRKKTSVDKATVLSLVGNLGSGKTTFVQGIAKALLITEHATSPTFVIEKIYTIKNDLDFKYLIHIDAYRIEDPKELITLGFEDIINNSQNLIAIEWANNISSIIPDYATKLNFTFVDDKTRKIS